MRFDLNDDQRAIRQAVREICAAKCDRDAVRRIVAGEDGGAGLWQALTDAGWTGLAVAAEHGGQGFGVLELSLATEELGFALAPAGFLGTVAAGLCVTQAGDAAQRRRWLPGIASGSTKVALGLRQEGGRALALDTAGADWLLLVGAGSAGMVRSSACTIEPIASFDLTRGLARVEAAGVEPLGGDVAAALDRVEVIIAAELVGVAQHALDMAVAHAKTRQQFDRAIGAYQGVSHRCAEMLIHVESARSAVLAAGWTADHDPDALPMAASVAKAAAANGAWRVAASALQIHGGIGFSWEHDIHLLLRRAGATGRLLGSADEHLDRAAGLGGLDQPQEREPRVDGTSSPIAAASSLTLNGLRSEVSLG